MLKIVGKIFNISFPLIVNADVVDVVAEPKNDVNVLHWSEATKNV